MQDGCFYIIRPVAETPELICRTLDAPATTAEHVGVDQGWRSTTVDVDLKLDPEPAGIFEAIGEIKTDLDVNIELSAPDQFLPPPPDWRERLVFLERQAK